MFKNLNSPLPSLFALSAGIFSYYVLLFPLSSVVFISLHLFVIFSLAPIGMMLGGLAFHIPLINRRSRQLEVLTSFVPLTILFALFFLTWLKYQEPLSFEFNAMEEYYTAQSKFFSDRLFLGGLVLAVPFFLYGIILSSYFSSKDLKLNKTVFIELLGASIGSLVAPFLLEWLNYKFFLVYIFTFLALAGVASKKRRYMPLIVLLFSLVLPVQWIEPQPPANALARDFSGEYRSSEIRSFWTAYGRSGLIKKEKSGIIKYTVSLNNSDGITPVPHFEDPHLYGGGKTKRLVSALPGHLSTLILFAGAGPEIVRIKSSLPESKRILGIEINPSMRKALRYLGREEYFNKKSTELKIAEARTFLERTSEKFDRIVFSWNGATIANYLGTIGHTAQFAFTTEAVSRALNLLNQNGYLVILNANKLNLIASLRKLYGEKAKHMVLMLVRSKAKEVIWKDSWDDFALIVRPEGFNKLDIMSFQSNLLEYKIALAGNEIFVEEAKNHWEVLNDSNPIEALNKISESNSRFFTAHTDKRPFTLQVNPPLSLYDFSTWRLYWSLIFSDGILHHRLTLFLFVLFVGFIFLTNFSLFKKTSASASVTNSTGLALCIWGAAFFAFEIAILQVLTFILGSPTKGIAFGVASVLLGSGLGSIYAKKFKTPFLGLCIFLGTFAVLSVYFSTWLIRQNELLSLIILSSVIVSSSIFSGAVYLKIFTYFSERDLPGLGVGWYSFGAALSVILAPLILENHGTPQLIMLSVTLFGFAKLLYSATRIIRR